jgi:hypothetical protein
VCLVSCDNNKYHIKINLLGLKTTIQVSWTSYFNQNLKVLGLWIIWLIKCSTSTFLSTQETNSPHTCQNNLRRKCESFNSSCSPSSGSFLHPYTCTVVGHTQRDTPPNHHCQKDFRYKELVEPFVDHRLLYHRWIVRGVRGSSTSSFEVWTTSQVNQTRGEMHFFYQAVVTNRLMRLYPIWNSTHT